MKIQIENKTITEVEIQLPLYRINDQQAFKVYSETNCIWVSGGYSPSISEAHASLAWNNKNTKDCTQEEFMEIYKKALNYITNIIIPTTQ